MRGINKKLNIFIAAAVVLVTYSGSTDSNVHAKELKLAHFMPPVHHLHKNMFVPLAKNLAAATNGKLTIKIYPSGGLGKGPVQQYKRVVTGVADIVFVIQAYTAKLFPKAMIAGKAGLGKTGEEVTRRIWKVYDKYLTDEFTKAKLLALWGIYPATLISRKKPIRTLADIKGMKFRLSSAADIPQMKAWGGVGIMMPVTKTYNALQNGVIDGIQIAPVALYRPWNFNEPAEFVTHGINGPSTIMSVMMNNKSWDGLSKSEQSTLYGLMGKEASIKIARSWGQDDEKALKNAENGKGVKLIRLSPAEAAPFNALTDKANKEQLAIMDKKGIPATEIFNAMMN